GAGRVREGTDGGLTGAQIGLDEGGLAAFGDDVRDDGLAALGAAAADDHVGAVAGEATCDGRANTRGGTGHEGALACESGGHLCFSLDEVCRPRSRATKGSVTHPKWTCKSKIVSG